MASAKAIAKKRLVDSHRNLPCWVTRSSVASKHLPERDGPVQPQIRRIARNHGEYDDCDDVRQSRKELRWDIESKALD